MWPVFHDSHLRAFNFQFNVKYIRQLSHDIIVYYFLNVSIDMSDVIIEEK